MIDGKISITLVTATPWLVWGNICPGISIHFQILFRPRNSNLFLGINSNLLFPDGFSCKLKNKCFLLLFGISGLQGNLDLKLFYTSKGIFMILEGKFTEPFCATIK